MTQEQLSSTQREAQQNTTDEVLTRSVLEVLRAYDPQVVLLAAQSLRGMRRTNTDPANELEFANTEIDHIRQLAKEANNRGL